MPNLDRKKGTRAQDPLYPIPTTVALLVCKPEFSFIILPTARTWEAISNRL